MITRLHLQNFRRHEDTELTLSPDAQVVLISGANGVGKSSILQGIHYSLWGEGATPRTKLDSLVRRGAELEGMQVELDFEVGSASYQVVRRREGKNSFAQLYGNGSLLVEGAVQVSQEVGRILGMDARGFRLAVTAHQKELDGLADLTPARRAQTISRLLRLDAITRAKDTARTQYNLERRIVEAMGSGADLEALGAELDAARAALASSTTALVEGQGAIAELQAELAAAGAIEEAYQAAITTIAHVSGRAEGAQARYARARAALDALVLPPAVELPATSLADLEREALAVEGELVRARSARETASNAAMVAQELEDVRARLAAASERAASFGGRLALDEHRLALLGEQQALAARRAELEGLRDELRTRHGRTSSTRDALLAAIQAAQSLGDTCDRCGQEVGEDHRHRQEAERAAALAAAEAELAELLAQGTATAAEIELLRASEEALRQRLQEVLQGLRTLDADENERPELERRRDTYEARLKRLQVEEVDEDALFARKAQIALERSQLTEATERHRLRAEVLRRRDELTSDLEDAASALAQAEAELAASALDADLQAAYERLEDRKRALRDELELSAELVGEHRAAQERLEQLEARLVRAEADRERRRVHEQKAIAAANASKLLEDVEARMATQIRPALEGSVSQLVAALSDGRFDAVRIDVDYEMRIRDDGAFRPLSEFSGGEQDLIALALRLALASVVAERHGAGGAGFLILDECFGSQDPARRESILTALRNLRSIYGQILLISHVGGLEDAADAVVEVSSELRDGERVASLQLA